MFPSSYAQQRLWFLNRLEGPNATYNAPLTLRLAGRLDTAALGAAWRDVLQRHESLRTGFAEEDGAPLQVVHPADDPRLAPVPADCAAADLAAKLGDLQSAPFDLAAELPVRAHLLTVGAEDHVLVLVMHHIVSDGWSMAPLLRDLAQAYAARADGRDPGWEPLPVQYADYTLWQRDLLDGGEDPGSLLNQQLGFWRQTLAGLPEELELPADRPRPAAGTHRGGQVSFDLGPELTARLRETAAARGATLFMVLQAGLAALLTRLGSGTDIPLGTVVAGRTDEALDDLVGFFVNTLVLRTDTSGDPGFAELLDRAKAADLAAYSHQDVPFDRLVEELNPVRSRSRHPLVQVSVELHSADGAAADWPGLTCTELPADLGGVAKLDLTWDFFETAGTVTGELAYATDLFDAETGELLAVLLRRLLSAAAADPATPLSRLPILTAEDRHDLLVSRHRAQHADLTHGVVARIREHAQARPAAPAVTGPDGGTLDYATLVGRAGALGRRLRPGPEAARGFVAVLADRGPAAVTALLGILGAGCAYFPLDTRAPLARNADRLADTRAARIVTDPANEGRAREIAAAAGHAVDVIVLGPDAASDPLDDLPPIAHGPDDLAYAIFTSGSTGRPKGAMVAHRGLVNNLLGEAEAIGIDGAGQVVASSAPLTFDISVWQMLTALIFGGRVQAVDQATARDPRALFAQVIASGTTVLQVVPSLLQAALDDWDARGGAPARLPLTALAVTGEALPGDVARRWLARYPEVPLVNCYGPTECSDDVTQAVITAATAPDGARSPIGAATRGMALYVLDEHLGLVPAGVSGELYIGGTGVGLGYLDDPGRTAAVFVPDPFCPEPGRRMYRTGDVVRYLRDGQLEFLGRQDHQVKIRGHRIELGEVECAMRQVPGVRDAAAAVVTGPAGQRMLAGYYTGDATGDGIRTALAAGLTDAMVPAVLTPLTALPLTPNGKLDRKDLPAPDLAARPAGREPGNAREKELCQAFEEVLGITGVGVDDGFFDLGGHSLLAIRLLTEVNRRLGTDLPVGAVFERQTPAALAGLLDGDGAAPVHAGPAGAELAADVWLDEDIRATGPLVHDATGGGAPRHILLTGATGFLGAYVLRDLLTHTDATVHCLVRAADERAARRRIEEALAGYGLWDEAQADRIAAVPGDLGKPLLGLSAERFDALAGEVELILHNGSRVNLMDSYDRLKPANVDGVREILRLAVRHRTKPVHYVSTISTVVAGPDDPAVLPESWVSDPALIDPYGYVRSKWVAEGILRIAGERGVPVAVHRPSRIAGDSATGAVGGDDAFWHYVRACAELGARPAADAAGDPLRENMVPVDFVSRAYVHLALTGPADGRVYSLVNSAQTELAAVLDKVRAAGYPMAEMPFSEWLDLLRKRAAGQPSGLPGAAGSSVPAVALLAGTSGDAPGRYPDVFDRDNLLRGLAGTGIACPPTDGGLIDRWLGWFGRTSFLPVRG